MEVEGEGERDKEKERNNSRISQLYPNLNG